MACSKQFSLTIAASAPLWVWGTPDYQKGLPFPQNSVPSEPDLIGHWFSSANYQLDWDNRVIPVITSDGNWLATNTATLAFAGPLTNFNLHIDVTAIGDAGTAGASNIYVQVLENAVPIFVYSISASAYAIGSYDQPFSIPASAGSVITLENVSQCFFTLFPPERAAIEYAASVTVIP